MQPHFGIHATGRATMIMAKDSDGRKFNRIPGYDRVQNGKTIHVYALVRNNRSYCKEQKKNNCSFLFEVCYSDVNRYGIIHFPFVITHGTYCNQRFINFRLLEMLI